MAESATVGSLFSGIGGIDLGLERAGMRVAWQCEKDEAARRVLARRWPDVHCYDDVTTLKGPDVPRVDVLCGGFPCQDLSVAGRRAGLAGERSGLFHEFMRLASELAPRWVLVENVPGLLSSGHRPDCDDEKCGCCDPGADMATVLATLADLGYGWCYRVLDAQFFGVAQRRRRVFIVGCAGDAASAAQVLLEPASCEGHPAPSREAGEGIAGTLGGGSGRRGFCDDLDRSGAFIPEPVGTLRSHPRPGSNSVGAVVPIGFQSTNGIDVQAEDHTSPAIKIGSGLGIASPPSVAYNPYRTLEKDGSITSGFAARPVVDALHGPTGNKEPLIAGAELAVRRLTPLECERLQGFPDGWTDGLEGIDGYGGKQGSQGIPGGISDSVRYRLLGNAVCVPVAQWIGDRIAGVERGEVDTSRSTPSEPTHGPKAGCGK